jgi:membrane-anchored protein YejM (alkaline phosphatase superfamily)
LASSIKHFPHSGKVEAWQSDEETIRAFASDLANHPQYHEGQCFIFFWDATHFDYSWPKDKPPLFAPTSSGMNYFKAYSSRENIEAMKNSYRNSVHFIDGLFGHFLSIVPNREQAIIAFTGDHGEEFFEHGHLFHLSQLCDVQTQVPIYFQLPRNPSKMPALVSQMDIFPTLIDSLTMDRSTAKILEGQSLFLEKRWPYVVMARYNASRTPCEFCLHNGNHKLIVRFTNHRNIFRAKFLQIISLRTLRDRVFGECKKDLDCWIRQEFGSALERLFPASPNDQTTF